VPIGTAIPVDQDTVQPISSASATVTSVGRYCWRGFFDGAGDVPDATDATEGECFNVNPKQPTLSTTASADVTLGTAITDTATLTGTATQPGTNGGSNPGGAGNTYPSINATNGAPAGGSITWTLRGPNNCTDAGLTITGSPATVSGNNTYGPASATPTLVGTYTWVATYGGSSPNTLGAGGSCPPGANDGDEVVIVSGNAAITSAQRWLPNDRIRVTGPTNLNGTLTVTLYPTDNCTGTAVPGQSYSTTFTNATSPQLFSTSNTTFFVGTNPDGTAGGSAPSYSWKVHYDDTGLNDPTDLCEKTTLTITD
jgi:hypothetical protein